MGYVESTLNYFTDTSKKMSHKMAIAIIVVTLVFLIDNIFNFSFHYRKSNQISDLRSADAIIMNEKADSTTRAYASYLREQIMDRKSIGDYLNFRRSSLSSKYANTSNPAQMPNNNESNIRNSFIYIFSTSSLFFLIGFAAFSFNMSRPNVPFANRMATGIIFFFLFSLLGYAFHYISLHIPIIKENPTNNYIVNFIIQLAVVIISLAGLKWQTSREKKTELNRSNPSEENSN